MQIHLHVPQIDVTFESRVHVTTEAGRNVTVSRKQGGSDALSNAAGRVGGLRHRRENPRAASEEEDGAGRVGSALGAVSGTPLEDRTRTAFSNVADVAAHRARVQCAPGILLRGRAREAAGGCSPQGGTHSAPGPAGWEGCVVSI